MYLSIGETPIKAKVDCPSIVAKRMGDSCTQVGEPGSEYRQTRRSPAHSCHKDSFASVQKRLQESTELLHPISRSPNLAAIMGDGADYKLHRNDGQGEGFRDKCRTRSASFVSKRLTFTEPASPVPQRQIELQTGSLRNIR
jgi:hypothetical protein